MKREETKRLLMAIDSLYNTKAAPDLTLKIDLWTEVLGEITLEAALQSLKDHAKKNKFPPSVHDFIKEDDETRLNVPSYQETMFNLKLAEEYETVRHPEKLYIIGYEKKKTGSPYRGMAERIRYMDLIKKAAKEGLTEEEKKELDLKNEEADKKEKEKIERHLAAYKENGNKPQFHM